VIGPDFPDESPPIADNRMLRQFAVLCVVVFSTLFVISWYRNQGAPRAAAWVGLILALLVGVPGYFHVGWIRPVFWAATAVTRPIGHVMGKVALAIVFFGLVTPLGWLFRLIGRDPLDRRRVEAKSFWIPISEPEDVRRYVHQYQKERSSSPSIPLGV
jgi:hypothetical protein